MSEIQASTLATSDPAAQAWLNQLSESPDRAIDEMLMGSAWLGGFASLNAPQAIPQFLPEPLVETLDRALQAWVKIEIQRTSMPDGATAKQYAQAISDAFGLVQVLDLPLTRGWCRERANRVWGWLQVQPSFPSRDPRIAFLRAMALVQPNRDLLDFWIALCRQGQKAWVQIALFGLRRLPVNDQGLASPGLPTALITGLVDYGLALAARSDAYKRQWFVEVDFLSAVYPMSKERWQSRFREALSDRAPTASLRVLRHWLDERMPAVNQVTRATSDRRVPLLPGRWKDVFQPLLEKYDKQVDQTRAPLQALVDRHLHFVKETGDSYFLVRTYCRLGQFLLQPGASSQSRDAKWAFDLGQVAASWAPSNPHAWSLVARSLDAADDWTRARATFWYARRRFPHNAYVHTQLGHALAMRGLVDEGEAVYRAAIRRFPDDAVCWADLGNTLRVAGLTEKALGVYREAQQRFHRDPFISNALCGVLIELGRVDAAAEALAWAEQVSSGDDKSQRILATLRQRLRALAEGVPVPPKKTRPWNDRSSGDWSALDSAAGTSLRGIDFLGEAALWRESAASANADKADFALAQAGNALNHDARWLAEKGLLLGDRDGWHAASDFFDRVAAQRPGDGEIAALRLLAHQRSGEFADWAALRGRFEALAPLIRVSENANAKRPAELDSAVEAVTNDDGVDFDQLDDTTQQALWVYETANNPELASLAQLDFLASRQLAVF